MNIKELKSSIENAWEARDGVNAATTGVVRAAVDATLDLLDAGALRVAEKQNGTWVVNAWAKTHPHTLRCFAARKSLLLNTGVAAYVAAQPLFLYPAGWMADRQDWLAEQDAVGVAHFAPIDTVLKRIAAIEAFGLTSLPATPTLVIATKDDVLVPYTCSVELADALPNGRLAVIDQGGHACNITDPAGFDALAGSFLSEG